MNIRILRNNSGFTLVELLIGMTIFAIGMTGIYALLSSTMNHASYSRHEIVVANILREELELAKNTRDTNIRNFLPWDRIRLDNNTTTTFSSGIYLIENDFSSQSIQIDKTTGDVLRSPILLRDVTSLFQGKNTLAQKFDASRLILDTSGRYTHAGVAISGDATSYAAYLIVTPMEFHDSNNNLVKIQDNGKPQGFILDARVIVNSHGVYREYDAKNAITDWIR